MFKVEKMNGCFAVLKGSDIVSVHRLKRDASAEAFYLGHTTMKTVTVMGTDTKIQIPVNTPLACDPSSETYWSM